MTRFVRIRLFIVSAALLIIAATIPAQAQKLGPDGAPNPTASVTDQGTLLKQAPRIEGLIDIPDQKASVLESAPQPKSPVAKLSLWPVMVMSEKSGSALVNDGIPPPEELVR